VRPGWLGLLALLAGQAAAGPAALQALGEGVYVLEGRGDAVSAANDGRVANLGVVIGACGVVLIDTGAHRRHGEALKEALRSVTDKPVALVVNTRAGPEHVLGNAAFRGATILASAQAAALMAERCPRCRARLAEELGEAAMAGSETVLPSRGILEDESGYAGGRHLSVLLAGRSRGEGDLAVFDESTGVLFAGALVVTQGLPDMHAADTQAWIAVLERLDALPVRLVVPGRGPVAGPAAIAQTRRYLVDLWSQVIGAYRAGAAVTDLLGRSPDMAWASRDAARHTLNLQHVYAEIERAELGGSPTQE
jgi:glyoxylase-like metal-dependent hydrolase (beta-lactamase superfamily II)